MSNRVYGQSGQPILTVDQWRRARGLTWRGLAQEAGVCHETVHRAIDNRPTSTRTRRLLADALGVDILDIAEFRASILGE